MSDLTELELAGIGQSLTAEIGERILARTLDLTKGWADLASEQVTDLSSISRTAAAALSGNRRSQLHLEAQLALRKFSTEARGYLEWVEFREALAVAILDVAGKLIVQGAMAVANAFAVALCGEAWRRGFTGTGPAE